MKVFKLIVLLLGLTSIVIMGQEESAGKFSGLAYLDYFYNIERDANSSDLSNTALSGEKDFNGFAFRRIYFTYDYKISNDFSSRFRLEMDQKSNTSDGKFGVAVKDAYLKWKNIFDGSDIIIGLSPTIAYEVSEKYWGYRSLEKTQMDLRGIVSSRDLGIALKGNLAGSGMFKYALMFGNGSANKPETDKYKRVYANISIEPTKNLQATLYSDLKFKRQISDPNNSSANLSNNEITTALFVGYKDNNKYSVGVEGFYHTVQNELLTADGLEARNGLGLSLFGKYMVSEKISVLGRYDYFDPVSNADYKGDTRNFIIAGLDFKPVENVSIIPNIVFESYEKLANGTEYKSGVTGRVTLYYEF